MLQWLVLGDVGVRFYEKNIYLCLMLCVIFSIWGCSPSKNFKESSNQQSSDNEVKSEVEKYYQIGEKSSSDLIEIVLKSVEYSKTIPTFLFDLSRGDKTPDEGEFIKV
jgi:hypothetical protein